ncbi:MAG: NAD(P)H-dependent oxidoreductase [Bifidobacteriaceae bacterium]|jgi:fumarate reductase flavoprotein subunit|nr:NAD(P)H-dependent oxidoreductase [Bifidobacteriaceae bacterium]
MKILAIAGSSAKQSNNFKLLTFMKNHFVDHEISVVSVRGIPLFNENFSGNMPAPVIELATAAEKSDAVIIGCPEYNHSVPSALKSAVEWLSYELHPLRGKPVMLVGASTYPQGSSRAQTHLRDILNSPGIDAITFQGDEFLLGNAATAFDESGAIANEATVRFLEKCFAQFSDFAGHFIDAGYSDCGAVETRVQAAVDHMAARRDARMGESA